MLAGVRTRGFGLAELLRARRTDLLRFWVLGAQMRLKLAIALPLIVLFHFSDRVTGRHSRRVELPCAFRTSPAAETLVFDPYHFATHSGMSSATICDTVIGTVIAPLPVLHKLTDRTGTGSAGGQFLSRVSRRGQILVGIIVSICSLRVPGSDSTLPSRTVSDMTENASFIMKKLLLGICVLSMGSLSRAQSAPPLASAQSFAVLGATTVTNTGASLITGNLGVSPPGVSATGFSLTNHIVVGPGGGVTTGLGVVTGTIFVGDPVSLLAHADASKAYAALLAQTCNPANNLSGQDLGGLTLAPGVYCFNSSAQLTGQLTLNGNGVYVFQIGSTLTTGSKSAVVLANGALASNVFWQVGSSSTLGTGTAFAGNLIAFTSDTVTTGVSVAGRVFALGGAVTLDTNNITVVAPTSSGGGGGGGDHDHDACHIDDDAHDKDHDGKDHDRHDKDKDHEDEND